jgi:hypothetical protein
MQAPQEMVEDFRNHLWACFKYLGLGEPTPLQYAMADLMQTGPRDFQLQAGRGAGKSVINACFASWRLLTNPDRTIMVISATTLRAINFIAQVRQILEVVPYCNHLKPKEFDKDSAFGFNIGCRTVFGQDLSCYARGITGQITGSHADDIIVDDVEIEENADTPSAREKLLNKLAELEQIRNNTPDGCIRILGTYQSTDSIYLKLSNSYPIIKFPAVMPNPDVPGEIDNCADYILKLELEVGESTQPERFPIDVLKSREAKIGPRLFALHYKLDPTLSDRAKYPLKLEDLIVIDVNPEVFPEKITWEKRTPKKQIESFGISGDLLYEPQWISPNFIPYMQTAMFVDPSGRGSDETAICIASFVNGYVIVHELLGMQGGYEEVLLKKIAKLAYQYDINLIRVEANFGDAMYCNLLRPVVSQICGQVAIEDFRVSGSKEERIIRTLEPIMAVHKLIFNTKAIKDQENQKQITRITSRRGSLKHDDRVDILSSAVAYWQDSLSLDADSQIEKNKQDEYKQQIKDWMSNKRSIGILGDRLSGAILLNGSDQYNKKVYPSLVKKRFKR